jgi:hypothetical protein
MKVSAAKRDDLVPSGPMENSQRDGVEAGKVQLEGVSKCCCKIFKVLEFEVGQNFALTICGH